MMSLSVFFTYALQFYVPVEIILPWVHRRYNAHKPNRVSMQLVLTSLLFFFRVAPDHHLKAEYALRYDFGFSSSPTCAPQSCKSAIGWGKNISIKCNNQKITNTFRYLMVMVTFSLAAAIPKLDLFISLVRSVSLDLLFLLALFFCRWDLYQVLP